MPWIAKMNWREFFIMENDKGAKNGKLPINIIPLAEKYCSGIFSGTTLWGFAYFNDFEVDMLLQLSKLIAWLYYYHYYEK